MVLLYTLVLFSFLFDGVFSKISTNKQSIRTAAISLTGEGGNFNSVTANLKEDLRVIGEKVVEAKNLGAELVILSEVPTWNWVLGYNSDGGRWSRKALLELSEEWLDIKESWTATNFDCEGNSFNSKASIFYSCLARRYGVTLVANIPRSIKCKQDNTDCRDDGYLIFNSNVVFDSNGYITTFYHKRHLYGTALVIDIPTGQYVNDGIFEFDGVLIKIAICYDLYFKETFDVQNENVNHLLFSAGWTPSAPMYNLPMLLQGLSKQTNMAIFGANMPGCGDGTFVNGKVLESRFNENKGPSVILSNVPRVIPKLCSKKQPFMRHNISEIYTKKINRTETLDFCYTYAYADSETDSFSGPCVHKKIEILNTTIQKLEFDIPNLCSASLTFEAKKNKNANLAGKNLLLVLLAFENKWQPPYTVPSWLTRGCGLFVCERQSLPDGSINCLPSWYGLTGNLYTLKLSFKGEKQDSNAYPTVGMLSLEGGKVRKHIDDLYCIDNSCVFGNNNETIPNFHSSLIYNRFDGK